MAITKLLRIKETRTGPDKSAGLRRCLNYVLNPEKTDSGRLVSGNAGGDAGFIYEEMVSNKLSWGKTDGSQGFHYVISFSPEEEVPHELALQIGKEFCKELLKDEFIYVVASHADTPHSHVHIVFDSVNFRTGQKYHSGGFDWLAHIQPITDSLCEKYGLSVLAYDMEKERKCLYHKEWKEAGTHGEIKKSPAWHDVIRDDIEDCIGKASSWEDFLERMEALHYECRDGKYLSLRPYGRERFLRSVRLGPGYSKEELAGRIGKPVKRVTTEGRAYTTYGDFVPLLRSAHLYIRRGHSFSPQQRYFYKKYFRIAHLRHPGLKDAWKYKKEITRLGTLSEQASYLFNHDITGISDIRARLSGLEKSRGREAARERKLLKGILSEYRRQGTPGDIMEEEGGCDAPLPDERNVYQVHLDKALFGTVDFSRETFTARIPGTKEYIRLYSDDSRAYNHGNTISTYLYGEAEYQVQDAEGNLLRRVAGEKAKELFKYRALERKTEAEKPAEKEEKPWIPKN